MFDTNLNNSIVPDQLKQKHFEKSAILEKTSVGHHRYCYLIPELSFHIFVSLKIPEKYLVKGTSPAGLTEIEHYHITLSKTIFLII